MVAPAAAGAGAAAVDDGTGALAEIVASQTSLGSTRESSRKTRSHATRRASAAESAVTRACLSAASALCVLTRLASGVGIACSSSCRVVSSACLSFTVPLADRNIAESSAAASTASTTGMSTIHWFFWGRPRRTSSLGRRLIARMSVLDPEADRDRQRAELLVGLAQLLAELHAEQRTAHRDADADELLELVGDAAEVRAAARDHDLADAQRSGLVLVELERGDELAREGLELAPHRLASAIRLILGEPFRHVGRRQRELALHRLSLRRRAVELTRDRDVERRAAPVEHARELADAPVRDGEGGAVVADRDDHERRVGGRGAALHRGL